VRGILQQPTRQLSTLRPSATSRIVTLQASKPTLCRSFHQTWIWRAEEQKEGAEAEATSAAQAAEDAVEVAQEAEEDAAVKAAASEAPESDPAVKEAQEVAEGETAVASDAVEAASAAASSARAPIDQPRHAFPNNDPHSSTNFAQPSPSRILYVGNLFFEVTASQLESEFSRFGEITNSRIVTDARGLSKGFGYIEFAQQGAAASAVRELDQKVFQGRRMAVQYHVRRERRSQGETNRPNPPSKTLFIGNMSYQMSDKDLNGRCV
jgi:nucleolin